MSCWKRWRNNNSRSSSYPKEIIPKAKYVVNIDIDRILDYKDDFLICRRLKGTLEENIVPFNGKYVLKTESLGNIINMSTNLLGAKFKANKHIQFSPKGDGILDWDGKKVDMKMFSMSFQVLDNCSFVAYKGKILHNIQVPYIKVLSDAEKKNAQSLGINLDKLNGLNEAPLIGTIRLAHRPTMLNYWHVVMDLFPHGSATPLTDAHGAWKKRMTSFVLEKILTKNYIAELSSVPRIPRFLYRNKSITV